MFISRELDYALRILRALAENELLVTKQICDVEYIPQPYAYKILKKLEKAGLVKGQRGANGGYRLAKPNDEITIYDVYVAIEKDLYINECFKPECNCPHKSCGKNCLIHTEMIKMQNQITEMMKQRNIAQMLTK